MKLQRKNLIFILGALALPAIVLQACVSGLEQEGRNSDIFTEAKSLAQPNFTESPYTFSGNIASGLAVINALANSSGADSVITDTNFEGIVTIPASYGIGMGTNGCSVANVVYQRAFILEDSSAAVMVAYGLEPPVQDAAQSASMKHITNSRNNSMAVFGNRIRLTATRAIKYGAGTGTIPIITDFKNVQVISTRNEISYQNKTTAFSRAADLYRTRRIEGYVTVSPTYAECASGSNREFQFNYQSGYIGTLCVGATNYTDALTCTGSKVPLKFQLSYNLGAGTLSGFDTGDSFSYNFGVGSKVRLTGAIFVAEYNGDDSKLLMMLAQRIQAETLR